MDETVHRRWDIVLRTLTILGAIVVFLHGINRYTEEQHRNLKTRIQSERQIRERSFKMAMFERDLDTYGKIAEAASNVAVSNGANFKKAATRYEQLYWSIITTQDDSNVVGAMDNLRNSIQNVRHGLFVAGDAELHDQLKRRAHQLTLVLREAIRQHSESLQIVTAE